MSEKMTLYAVKRDWCPEWLWWVAKSIRLPWFGQIVLYQPFTWIFTRKVQPHG